MEKLRTKHPLRFGANGMFRVLMISDIQDCIDYDERSLKAVNALLDKAKPDLVILGGDNCDGRKIFSADELKTYLDIFTKPMEERKIPWAHVYGNHDYDVKCDMDTQQKIYESYPMCVSKHTDSTVYGKSNFVLPIYDKNGENMVFNVWGIDTNNRANALENLVPKGNDDIYSYLSFPQNTLTAVAWDIVRFEQLMWYWNTSCEIEKMCGQKIPGLMCMHFPPTEILAVAANPDKCIESGVCLESIGTGALNSGLFATVLQRGDIKTIGCGHVHKNDFCGEYCGIKICFDGCVGYNERTTYGDDETRGGRLFEINENDPWNIKTEMLYAKDLI